MMEQRGELLERQGSLLEKRGGLTTMEQQDRIIVAVCGLHMRGLPLEPQMYSYGATFLREAESAANYKLYALPTTPAKPGMIKQSTGTGGTPIRLELWDMPAASFGGFTATIPAPLGIGKVELADGTEVSGFICEGYAAIGAEDITEYGGWRSYLSK